MSSGRSSRIASLDILRLIAALAVVGFHYLFAGPKTAEYGLPGFPEAAPMAIFGYLGVNLFFLISGYVISWSAEGRDALDFAVARFVRLWPGHVVAMTATFAVMAFAAMDAFPVSWMQWLANLTMLAPAFGQPFMDGAYWSIVLELVFYFWVTVALMTGVFQRHKLELVAVWLLLALANETLVDSEALRMLFVTEYAGFFAGGIIAYEAKKAGWNAVLLTFAAAAFVFGTMTLFSGRAWMLDHYGVALSPAALVASSAVLHAVFLGTLTIHLRASKGIALAGAVTYPLYLLHQHVGYAVIDALAPHIGGLAAIAAATAIAVVAATVIVIVFERPAQRLMKPWLAKAADFVRRLALMRKPGFAKA